MRAEASRVVVKLGIWVAASLPIAGLFWQLQSGDLGANPVETLIDETGQWAMRLLLLCLALTPLRHISGWPQWLQYRRLIGLWAAFYATLHGLSYLALEQAWDWQALLQDILERPYITMGFMALCILMLLAATSFKAAIRRLGARWKALHEWVYIAATLVILHFAFLAKGDRIEPLVYALILFALFVMRWGKILSLQRATSTD